MKDLNDTNYNYVFYNVNEDYLEPSFKPLEKYPQIEVRKNAFVSNNLIQKLFFLHYSYKLNRRIRVPFKKLWFKKICNNSFDNNKPICFVFLGGKYINDAPELFYYIKKLNPENKVVIYCADLISKKNWNINKVKSHCDYIVTYDKGEAEKYDICHYKGKYYGALIDITTPSEFENDVYFLGFAKDRLDEIHNTFLSLKNQGFNCKFIVCGVDNDKKLSEEGLIYNRPISYLENLKNVQNSKCVLELIQGGSSSATLRTSEAQVYKRKLLTNNISIVYQDYYDASNMSVFSNFEDIDFDFIRKPIDYCSFVKRDMYNPYNRILFFEEFLTGD
ncbi:MAG: hypothetical protein IJR70_01580 [Eubacterium sp.]|nr:hypothetical protein [Eubacterium sp.]